MTKLSARLSVPCALVVLLTGMVAFSSSADAKPRFALNKGLTCGACHVNPSGGGMRTPYGSRVYAMTELPMGYPGAGTNQLIDLEVGQSLGIGGDLRVGYIDQRNPTPGGDETAEPVNVQNVMLMQADLYIAAQPVDNLTVYFDRGAYGSFEAMALYRQPFADWGELYFKAGRFMPSFGVRFVNHRVFNREDIGLGPVDKDTGAELGLALGPVLLQTSVLQGAGAKNDDNTAKAYTGRAELLLAGDIVRFMLGGSGYYNETGIRRKVTPSTFNPEGIDDTRTKQTKLAGHVGLSIGRLSVLSELALRVINAAPDNTAAEDVTSMQLYTELSIRVVRGLELLFYYEYKDPNYDLATGSAARYSAGIDYQVIPGLELYAIFRHETHQISGTRDAGLAKTSDGMNEIIALVHAYF